MDIKYQEDNDLANIEALKREMFKRAFQGLESKTHYHGISAAEVGSLAASAFANLIRAQVALKNSAAEGKPDIVG